MRGNNRAIGARLFAHPGNLPEGAMISIETAMHRAIALSEIALGLTSPNPIVGAVIINESGEIIAEGYHKSAGSEHAEIVALQSAGERAREATLVVTLEPCNHSGKTPPCTETIIKSGLKRVIYGVSDPNAIAAGGAAALRAAGIEVSEGILAEEVELSNRAWLKKIRNNRPFFTLKIAMSADGRVAAPDGSSKWITSKESRLDVAQLRSECDAIVTGTGTVLADDPYLTVRGVSRANANFAPVRIILGERVIPKKFNIFNEDAETIQVINQDLLGIVEMGRSRDWNRILIEAGPRLSSAFMKANLIDEVIIYQAPSFIGGANSALDDIGVKELADKKEFYIADVRRIPGDVENLRIQLLARSA